ncbi:MAG: hypothetical protein K2H53_05430 [Clostridia bacterium]|nr:hypothetical protein [Clostridia bacterium]
MKKNTSFDIDAWIDYFNLFKDQEYTLNYSVLDPDLALIDPNTGEAIAVNKGRTTIVVSENGSSKKAVISLLITEDSEIEPMVETAGEHTIMLKVDGTVWSYGKGDYGELGLGEKKITDDPIKVEFPNGIKIKQIGAGENHSLALDTDGNVWSWGRNNYYQLGNETDEYITKPARISGLSGIKKIACGAYNSFAVGSQGEVYSFGLNANGEGGVRKLYK